MPSAKDGLIAAHARRFSAMTAPSVAAVAAPRQFNATPVLTTAALPALSVLTGPRFMEIAKDLALLTPALNGKPRHEMSDPVAPGDPPADSQLFDDPADPNRRYYLPRYRIATVPVSGAPHYRARLGERDGQWRLEFTLERFPAPELPAPVTAEPLAHRLSARLRWELSGTGGVTRELPFTEQLENPDGTVTIALTVGSLPERDALFTALTSAEAHCQLLVQRTATLALPVPATSAPAGGGGGITLDVHMPVDVAILNPSIFTRVNPGVRGGLDGLVMERIARHPRLDTIRLDPSILVPPILVIQPPALPAPELGVALDGEPFDAGGTLSVRYRLTVTNWQAYDNALFAAAPDLPPCGANTSAARTWVDILDGNGQRLYGFCALGQAADLQSLWVVVPVATPPAALVVQLTDRATNRTVTSTPVAPPPVTLYVAASRTLEQSEPLLFNPAIHGYLFDGIAVPPGGGGAALVRRQVNQDGRWHSYYQLDSARHLFYYLPDGFKLARHPDPPHLPLLGLELVDPAGDQVALSWVALPHYDWDRLEAAEGQLAAHIPADDAAPVQLEPLQPASVAFVPFSPALYSDGSVTPLRLDSLQATLRVGREAFATLWDELNGSGTLSLGGKLRVAIQGFPEEEVPVTLRLDDTVGELLGVTAQVQADRYELVLTNHIESPLLINALSPFLVSAERGVADVRVARWASDPTPAGAVPPGGQFSATLLASQPTDLSTVVPLVDTDAVRAQPNRDAILSGLLGGVQRTFRRAVTVQLPAAAFSRPGREIAAVQVTFGGGETAILEPPTAPETMARATVSLLFPLRTLLLGEAVAGWYEYVVIVAWQDGTVSEPSEVQRGEAEQFFLRIPQLQG